MIRIRVQINCHTSLWYHILFLLRMDYSIVFCDHSLKFWRKSNFKVSRSEHQLSEELTCHIISGGQNHPQNAKYAFILAIYADIQISLPLCHSRSKFPNYLSINVLSLSVSLSVCLSLFLSLSLSHTHTCTHLRGRHNYIYMYYLKIFPQQQQQQQKIYILQVASRTLRWPKYIVHDPGTCFANKF